jgi:hypothetical protein
MPLWFGRLAWRFGQGCFLAKTGPRASRKYVRAGGGPRARRRSSGVGCPCPRLGSGEAWSSPSNGPIPDLVAPIRPLQLCADGGYQLRIRSLEGTPNYGPRQVPKQSLKLFLCSNWSYHWGTLLFDLRTNLVIFREILSWVLYILKTKTVVKNTMSTSWHSKTVTWYFETVVLKYLSLKI